MNSLCRTATVSLQILWLVAGCGALPAFNGAANEPRPVRIDSDPKKSLTLPNDMVWYTTPTREHGVLFPAGTYALEAEDDDYWYFRAPAPLDFRTFSHGDQTEQHTSAGGLMIAKHLFRLPPAGGYINADATTKTLILKLGGDFLAMEGHQWRKSW